ncbi:LamG-like jellyroll fold domain-containing protein, partial [Seonamhaeicola maritimus]
VEVIDNQNPVISCPSNTTINTSDDGTGNCTVNYAVVTPSYSDNCSASITWSMYGDVTDSGSGAIGNYTFPIGSVTIDYTVTDGVGLTATCSQTITIIDDENPTISCPGDRNVDFDDFSCMFTLPDYTGFAATSDNCNNVTVSQNPAVGTTISGNTIVTLTAADATGNTTSCTFNVIPADNEEPDAECQDITVSLSANGLVNITALDIENGSTDNCGIANATVSPSSFSCSDIGNNTVTYTVFDNAGNSNSCTATVTIEDNTLPTMICNDFVVVLDAITRTATISASDVDNGSNDACGIASLTVSPDTFNEDPNGNVYTTSVTLEATDVNGNINTCTATVTVEPPKHQETYLVGEIVAPIDPDNPPAPPSALIEATACPGGITIPKDVDFTLLPIDPFDLANVTVNHWEYSNDNGETWTTFSHDAGNPFENTLYGLTADTFVRLDITDNSDSQNPINKHSAVAFVRFLPPDEPPIIMSQSAQDICFGESVTIVAESFFDQPGGQFGEGGEFNYAQPDGWRVDGIDGFFPASGNNQSEATWKETNSNDNANTTFSGINYDTEDNTKFAIAHEEFMTVNDSTTLETPVFSTVGMTSAEAIMTFYHNYYFCNGAYGEIKLSFDSGNTYPVTLTTLQNDDLDSRDEGGDPETLGIQAYKENGNCNNGQYPVADPYRYTSLDLGAYSGLSGLRVIFIFHKGTGGCNDITFPKHSSNNCSSTQTFDVESAWAIDDVGFAYAQVDDELEWTDEDGIVIATGTTTSVTPVTPGVREYGVTALVNGCRADNDLGTNYVNINTSLAYAGQNYTPLTSECGENWVQLNAYDNTRNAAYNYNKGAWVNNLYVVPTGLDPIDANNTPTRYQGTGVTGVWSAQTISTSSCGNSITFSDNTDPDALFIADPGTYELTWTLQDGSGCDDTITVTIVDCPTIDFDGVNDYVTFRNNYELDTNTTSEFSIEVWVKPEDVIGTQTVFSRKDALDNTSGYDLSIVNGEVRFNWYNGGTGSVTSGSYNISDDRWYHLAVTFDGTTYNLYVDGIELGSTGGSAPAATSNNIEALLGAMDQSPPNDPTNYYHGWMDELRIWHKALSIRHIRQMMNQEIDQLGTDVGGVVIPTKIYGPDIDNNGTEDDLLLWSDLVGYYRMDLVCGDIQPYVGVSGRLKNITTSQQETAPLPYTTRANTNWDTDATWTYFDVWDVPNSDGIDGTPIDWNIVSTNHNVTSGDRDITVLGLLVNSGELTVTDLTDTQDETNNGYGLFVTDYLLLNGLIDLIGESQLIQKRYYFDDDNNPNNDDVTHQFNGSILDINSSGHLERDQQGQSNLFNYNYWSSPVSPTYNSDYSVNQVLKDGTDTDNPLPLLWTNSYNANPATHNGTTQGITMSRRWMWAFKNNPINLYANWEYLRETGTLSPGLSFTMKGSGDTSDTVQNYVFDGLPHNGTIATPISLGNEALVGNPYPCAIDAREFIMDNIPGGNSGTSASFDGALYFWVHYDSNNTHILRDYQGGYAQLTLTGGNPAVAPLITIDGYEVSGLGSSNKIPDYYIPVGQGFFVYAVESGSGSGDVTFHNRHRFFKTEESGESVFMKQSNTKGKTNAQTPKNNQEEDDIQRVRLLFRTPEGAKRHLLLGFTPDNAASDGFDFGYDAISRETFPNDMLFRIDDKNYMIQGVGEFDETKQYPIGIFSTTGGPVEIHLTKLENLSPNTKVYVYDALLGTYTKINNKAFEMTLDPGDYLDRFYITFTKHNTLSNDANDLLLDRVVVNYLHNSKEIYIKTNNSDNVKQVYLTNILGQTVKTWNFSDSSSFSNEVRIPIGTLSTGSYVVQVQTDIGRTNKKIVIGQ